MSSPSLLVFTFLLFLRAVVHTQCEAVVSFYDVINAVPFNGSTLTNTGDGCSLVGDVLQCGSDTKLNDDNTEPVGAVSVNLSSFFAFSRQSESDGILEFTFGSIPVTTLRVVLHFYNSPTDSIGLPSIFLTSTGNPPDPVSFTFGDNSDLTQTDSTIRNVSLIIESTLPNTLLRINFSFSDDSAIDWFLVSEVDFMDGFNVPMPSSIVFQDGPLSVMTDDTQSTVSISCTVVNSGSFEWTWEYNGTMLISDGRYHILVGDATRTSVLMLDNPVPVDSGNYSCIATDQNGISDSRIKTTELLVNGFTSSSSSSSSESIHGFTSTSVHPTASRASTSSTSLNSASQASTSSSSVAPPLPSPADSSDILPVAIGATFGIVLLLVAIGVVLVLIFFCAKRKRKMASDLKSIVNDDNQSQLRDTGVLNTAADEKQKESEMMYSVVIKDKPPAIPPQNFNSANEADVDEKTKQNLEWRQSSPPKLAKISKPNGFDLVDNPLYNESLPAVQAPTNEPYYSCAEHPNNVVEAMYSEIQQTSAEPMYSQPDYFDLKNPIYDKANGYSETQPFSFVSSDTYSEGPIYSVPEKASDKRGSVIKITEESLQEIKHLGVGQFGEVVLAKTSGLSLKDLGLDDEDDNKGISLNVAVKKVKLDADDASMISFEKEMKFMSQLKHENVVQLLAISKDECEPFMVMEYMESGDLNQFLLWHQVTKSHPPKQRDQLSPQILLSMAIQVASGLSYLASHNYIHRDVATRNCLVGKDNVLKIADFGLSRSLYDSVYYRVKGKAKMPIRWMAVECFYGKFSQFSDVWAYGVTVWEIYTMAREPPYPTLDDQEVLDDALKGENRMLLSKPPFCPQEVYDLLCFSCFVADYRKRATFASIHNQLLQIENQIYN